MKKIINLLAIFVAFCAFSVTAQEFNNYAGSSRFFDNWSIGLEGGVQTNLNEWNAPQGGLAGLNINKQISPVFGVSLEGYAGFNNTANWYTPVKHVHNGNFVDNVNVYLSGRWNMLNSFGGYYGEPRVFEIETNVGLGYGHFFYSDAVGYDHKCMLGKAGLNFNFNLGEACAWTLSVKPAVVYNFTDASAIHRSPVNKRNAVFQVTAGVTYNFKTSNGKHYMMASPVDELVFANGELNAWVNALRADVENMKNQKEAVVYVDREIVSETVRFVDLTYVVTFAFDNAVLSDEAKEALDKVPVGTTVEVVAWASPEGTKVYNEKLSVRRADSVAEYLKARGVNVSSIKGEGSVNAESNRIAIVTVVD